MKKTISFILSAVMLVSSLCFVPSALAEEKEFTPIILNTQYEASFDSTDEVFSEKNKQYYDTFGFELDYAGSVTLTVKSAASGYTSKFVRYIIADRKSDKFWSPDSSDFKGKWSVKLKKGSYYFIPVYTLTNSSKGKMLGETYNFKLAYKPTLKAPKLSKAKAKKKGFKAVWKKVKSIDGYQVQYGVKKNFKKSKKIKIEDAKAASVAVNELKSKKTYYIRVRTYKTFTFGETKKTYYSKWSKAKTVKTK